jgi:hypothetical protein
MSRLYAYLHESGNRPLTRALGRMMDVSMRFPVPGSTFRLEPGPSYNPEH